MAAVADELLEREPARAAAMSRDELGGGDGPALGSDPFLQSDGTLPYLIRLRERERAAW